MCVVCVLCVCVCCVYICVCVHACTCMHVCVREENVYSLYVQCIPVTYVIVIVVFKQGIRAIIKLIFSEALHTQHSYICKVTKHIS